MFIKIKNYRISQEHITGYYPSHILLKGKDGPCCLFITYKKQDKWDSHPEFVRNVPKCVYFSNKKEMENALHVLDKIFMPTDVEESAKPLINPKDIIK